MRKNTFDADFNPSGVMRQPLSSLARLKTG